MIFDPLAAKDRRGYMQSQSRSDCYPILLNMQSHRREATVIPRRRGEAASMKYDRGTMTVVRENLR